MYERLCAKHGLDSENGCAVHCTCDYQRLYEAFDAANHHSPSCPTVVPNFRHKRSGFHVNWYKWIGRGMELIRPVSHEEWAVMFAECVTSVTGAP
jgi:hypothetical protein